MLVISDYKTGVHFSISLNKNTKMAAIFAVLWVLAGWVSLLKLKLSLAQVLL